MEVTLKNFLTDQVTKQQVFDFTMKKLIEQGEPSVTEAHVCMYTSPDGKHCAIGWLCLDLSPWEGDVASAMFDRDSEGWEPDLDHLLRDKHDAYGINSIMGFLDDLQSVHDRVTQYRDVCHDVPGAFVRCLKEQAHSFAKNYNLDASVLAEGASE